MPSSSDEDDEDMPGLLSRSESSSSSDSEDSDSEDSDSDESTSDKEEAPTVNLGGFKRVFLDHDKIMIRMSQPRQKENTE